MRTAILIATCIALALSDIALAQKPTAEYLEQMKIAGYSDSRSLSFSQGKSTYALSGLVKTDARDDIVFFHADVISTKEGASVVFKADRLCVPNATVMPRMRKIMKVDGQKIEVAYLCLQKGSSSGSTQEVHLPISDAAKDFVKRSFAAKSFVWVEFEELPVPFATDGFSKVLTDAEGKAL